MKASHRLLDGS